tara:strand:- start:49 stop:462 length:414 start_codon:yes stop_codon:yes gene_type:complete
MATVTDALKSLNIDDWYLRGDPQNEQEFISMFAKIIGTDSDGNVILSNEPENYGVTWKQVSDELKKLQDAEPMIELRRQRDAKLAETDFYALSDVTMSDDMKTYRQELRDLPSKSKDVAFDNDPFKLKNVTWPKKPE